MPRTYIEAPTLGAPALPHTMTPAAEAAREAVDRYVHARNLDRIMSTIVTLHGRPKRTPIPANAERLRRTAQAKGFEVRVGTGHRVMNAGKRNESNAFAWTVAGMDRLKGVGFRAVWVGGKAHEGHWYTTDGGQDVGVSGVTDRLKELPDA